MRLGVLCGCLALLIVAGNAWAMDEGLLTPTDTGSRAFMRARESDKTRAASEAAFNSAMDVWFSHRYGEGDRQLREFAHQYPGSRWRAEAELHCGCYCVYTERYAEGRRIFTRLASEFSDTNIREKATARLGNIAEREGHWDEAIGYYSSMLTMNPTWAQFRYANYRARKIYMTRDALQAKINCGPVALAACLEKLGKSAEAQSARSIKPSPDGMSLFALAGEAGVLGVGVQTVELPFDDLRNADLPVVAHISPNHYIAVLGIDGDRIQAEDSIRGKHELLVSDLKPRWSGRAITFAPASALAPLSQLVALETSGGCCGSADASECLGDKPCDCMQEFIAGSDGCTECAGVASGGRPTWKVNTVNLNLIVKDTPIWYNPGKGPLVAFTLTYSNESSNAGIFGRGWRCPYDQRVFFLPDPYETNPPSLQLHRESGRIETYTWDTIGEAYVGNPAMGGYGYRDTIKVLSSAEAAEENISDGEGTVMLTLRGGAGKIFFKKAGSGLHIEGRVYIIQDAAGSRVTCAFDDEGNLSSVTDANGRVTTVTTTHGLVTQITLPSGDGRYADFGYTDGNLTSITDMAGYTSTLKYNAMLRLQDGGMRIGQTTHTMQNVNEDYPADDGSLEVESTQGFLQKGTIMVGGQEFMTYSGKTDYLFLGITRGEYPIDWDTICDVQEIMPATRLTSPISVINPQNNGQLDVVDTSGFPESGNLGFSEGFEKINYTGRTQTAFTGITRMEPEEHDVDEDISLCWEIPYLSEVITPTKKTRFTYENWRKYLGPGVPFVLDIVALHEVYECGVTEGYPGVPTIHFSWCETGYGNWPNHGTDVTRYPTSVTAGALGCSDDESDPPHWTGGLTKKYTVYPGTNDATGFIYDEYRNQVVAYSYNQFRDRIIATDASLRTTEFDYGSDGLHNMYTRLDPQSNEWNYTYNANHAVDQETDPYDRSTKKHSYDDRGRVTRVETQLTSGTWTILAEYGYSQQAPYSLEWTKDGRGKQTTYHYNEDGETRGFLTSVHDPENRVTTYHYDSKGRRDRVTDPAGITTSYDYDDLDRVTRVTYGEEQGAPHADSEYTCCHLDKVIDENGIATRFVYDQKSRPWATVSSCKDGVLAQNLTANATSIILQDATAFPDPPAGQYAVAVVQHRFSGCTSGCEQYTGLEVITYNGKDGDTLTGVNRAQFGTSDNAFDSGDRVTVGTVMVNGYDSVYLNRVISRTDALGHATYYTYYKNDKLESVRYPDGTGEWYTYDRDNSGGDLIERAFGTFSGSTFTATNGQTAHYEYDENHRLLRTTYD